MRQTHKRKIICSLKGERDIGYLSQQCSGLSGVGGVRPNKSHFHIYIQAVEINLKSHQEKKRNKTQRKHQKEQLSNFQIHGARLSPNVWNADFFLTVLLNGAWHFHYSRKLNWLIFLQALYVCYFREVHRGEQLFHHLHKRKANVDVLSEEKWFQILAGNLFFDEGI